MVNKKLILLSVVLLSFLVIKAAGPSLVITDLSDVKLSAALNQKDTARLFLDGNNLKGKMYLTLTGVGAGSFKLSKDSISNTAGVIGLDSVFVYYLPTTEGQHTALLTFSSLDATSIQYNVIGNSLGTLTDPWPVINDAFKRQIKLQGEQILFVAGKGENIELISSTGALLFSEKSQLEGQNKIQFPKQQVVILRIGLETYKLTRN